MGFRVVTCAPPPAFLPLDSQGSGALSHWDGEISGACMAVNAISQVSQRCQFGVKVEDRV
jgi:hypothetical protein